MTADQRIKHSSRSSVFIHPNDMAEPAKLLDINTLSNVHVTEELIQLPVVSDTVVNAIRIIYRVAHIKKSKKKRKIWRLAILII